MNEEFGPSHLYERLHPLSLPFFNAVFESKCFSVNCKWVDVESGKYTKMIRIMGRKIIEWTQ